MTIDENTPGLVYYHRFIDSGKGYVGITSESMEKRLKGHLKADSVFGRALRRHGCSMLESIILASNITSLDELNALEIKFIEEFDTFKNGYNCTAGGDSVWTSTKGKTYDEIYGPEEAKRQILKRSQIQKNKSLSEEHIKSLIDNHADVSGKNNPRFKYFYFLSPDDELIKGVNGKCKTMNDYNIPHTLFRQTRFKTKTNCHGWAFIEKSSFDEDDETIRLQLEKIRYNWWINEDSPSYRYSKQQISRQSKNIDLTLISPTGIKYFCKTLKDLNSLCKKFGFKVQTVRDVLRGRTVGSRSPLYGWKITNDKN